jgi:hypothetical protein
MWRCSALRVHKMISLFLYRVHNLRVGVAGIGYEEAGCEVNVDIAIDI